MREINHLHQFIRIHMAGCARRLTEAAGSGEQMASFGENELVSAWKRPGAPLPRANASVAANLGRGRMSVVAQACSLLDRRLVVGKTTEQPGTLLIRPAFFSRSKIANLKSKILISAPSSHPRLDIRCPCHFFFFSLQETKPRPQGNGGRRPALRGKVLRLDCPFGRDPFRSITRHLHQEATKRYKRIAVNLATGSWQNVSNQPGSKRKQ